MINTPLPSSKSRIEKNLNTTYVPKVIQDAVESFIITAYVQYHTFKVLCTSSRNYYDNNLAVWEFLGVDMETVRAEEDRKGEERKGIGGHVSID